MGNKNLDEDVCVVHENFFVPAFSPGIKEVPHGVLPGRKLQLQKNDEGQTPGKQLHQDNFEPLLI